MFSATIQSHLVRARVEELHRVARLIHGVPLAGHSSVATSRGRS